MGLFVSKLDELCSKSMVEEHDPSFWLELSQKHIQALVPRESKPQVEDAEEVEFEGEDDGKLDDSDIPLKIVIDSIVTGRQPKILRARKNGSFESAQGVEPIGEDVNGIAEGKVEELGKGKRVKKANRLYKAF